MSRIHENGGLMETMRAVRSYLIGAPEVWQTIAVDVVGVVVITAGLSDELHDFFGGLEKINYFSLFPNLVVF